jgi:hypothetical protein
MLIAPASRLRALPASRRALAASLVAAASLAAAGCTSPGSGSGSKFSGAEGDVAKVVADLQQAGQRKDAEKICTEILSRTLVTQLSQAGTSCQQEMKLAIQDADDYALSVQDVTVKGNQATARVRRGRTGPTSTFRFVREDGRWKATDFGSGQG